MLFKNVVVGIDFSPASSAAVAAASVLTRPEGRLTLIHVVGTSVVDSMTYTWGTDRLHAHLESWAYDRLHGLATKMPTKAAIEIGRGNPTREIVAAALREDADAIVLGRGEGDLRHLLGSFAETVARSSPVPVLVVPARAVAARPDRVLLALDHDDVAPAATRLAFRVAESLGVPLDAVHVIDSSPFASELEGLPCAEPHGFPVQILHGSPGERILALARPSDVLVCGTHGRGALGRLAVGSVATELMRHAPCPVLVVRDAHGSVSLDAPAAPSLACDAAP